MDVGVCGIQYEQGGIWKWLGGLGPRSNSERVESGRNSRSPFVRVDKKPKDRSKEVDFGGPSSQGSTYLPVIRSTDISMVCANNNDNAGDGEMYRC